MFLEKNQGKNGKNKLISDNNLYLNDMLTDKHNQAKIIELKHKALSSESYSSPGKNLNEELNEINFDKLKNESRISYKLSESMLKKVILLISVLNIVIPFFDFYWSENNISTIYNTHLSFIDKYLESNVPIKESFLISHDAYPIINITYKNQVIYRNSSLSQKIYRFNEIKTIYSSSFSTVLCFDTKYDIKLNGYLIFLRCLFLSLLIVLATFRLENDAKECIIDPLEIMIELVDLVVKDPIQAKNLNYLESGKKNNVMKLKYHIELHNSRPFAKQKQQKKDYLYENYEIKIIKQALMKISALMAIGYGEAGGEIIKNNITFNHELNPMIKGKKMVGIFGFCIIKDFDLINHALQEKTFILVNLIAEIVHSTVDLHKGAANKNIGEAFLVVWKFEENCYLIKENNEFTVDVTNPNVNLLADQALLSYLDIYIKINKSKEIAELMNNHKVQEMFSKKYSKKISSPVKLEMGFGLHLGWAIEGSIGSIYKIDASYLSPNVNLSARLESATNLYGVKFLISGELFDALSVKVKKVCRKIDIVTVKGSNKPITLFTVDVNTDIKINKYKENDNILMKKFKHEQTKNEYHKWNENFSFTKNLLNISKFKALLNYVNSQYFVKCFEEAFSLYIEGSWNLAAYKFKDCLFLNPKDNVSKILLKFINSYFNKAPKDWKGYRELKTKI
jgi:class 3 adenylate cyclase